MLARSQGRLGLPGRLFLVWLASTSLALESGADDPFRVQVIPSKGRTVACELVDLDGDGRVDLMHAVTFGMPPAERRVIRVYPQQVDGSIPEKPELEVEVPPRSAAYDVADVDGRPGSEVLLLRRRGIGIISFGRNEAGAIEAKVTESRVPSDMTIGVADDERGLDKLRIALFGFGPEAWLVAPGLGETFFLRPDGEVRAIVESGARANYFLQPSGLMLSESDIQIPMGLCA